MSDMACIYEMNMIEENEQLEQDILAGRGMDVLFCLMEHLSTGREIARRLGMPNYSVQLYLQRLVKAGLVREGKTVTSSGQIEKYYSLVSNDIEIMNQLQNSRLSEAERKRKTEISAQHFAVMTRNAIKNVNEAENMPHKIKAYFMKAKKEDMEAFREEIDQLFQKYKAAEDLSAEDTYSLFTVLAPYEMEG